MSDAVIKVEKLTKKYRLGTINHGMLFRDLQSWWAKLRGKEDPNSPVGEQVPNPARSYSSTKNSRFLALDNVSFEVKQGDVLGIIGRNGAGKSTLLKVLSRVTCPTSGHVKLKGRVASLLEVGTGFHPELTGRENVFLNGAILGMSRSEIKSKFDEIVSFAEIEKFIDTPVKRYSSGMYVRLAFAVAAHLEPEILIIDEVLAVGDVQFQKKCMGKMQDVGKEGRTVLFVSHNMQVIGELCNSCILLENGSVIATGQTERIIAIYTSSGLNMADARRDLTDPFFRNLKISSPSSFFKWSEISIYNSKTECKNDILFGEPFEIRFKGFAQEKCYPVIIGLAIHSKKAGYVFSTHQFYNELPDYVEKGFSEYRVVIDTNFLAPGNYSVAIGASGNFRVADYTIDDAISFTISNAFYTKDLQWRSQMNVGVMLYPCRWALTHPDANGMNKGETECVS